MWNKNKMSGFFRSVLYGFIAIIVLVFIFLVITQKLIEHQLEGLINSYPDRAYNISYDELKVDPFLKGFKLKNAQINPFRDQAGSTIICQVELIRVRDLKWLNLLIHKKLILSEMIFIRPSFVLTQAPNETDKAKEEKKVMQLFGDILSRAELTNFKLQEGSFSLINKYDGIEMGRVGKINLEAKNIETDSLQWKHTIPFKLAEISFSLSDIMMHPDDHSTLTCRMINYEPELSSLTIEDVSWRLTKNWIEVSELIGESTDIIEMDLKSLLVSKIGSKSKLYGERNLSTQSILIDGLKLMDSRNKQLPRFDKKVQPLFSGVVALIPFDLEVDTLQFINSDVIYTELSKNKTEAGILSFNDLNGTIYNLTTIDSIQQLYEKFELNVEGKINNAGQLKVLISAPYDVDEFYMKGQVKSLYFKDLNSTLQPMSGIVAESGKLYLMDIEMYANSKFSKNIMIVDYDSLKLNLVEKVNEEISIKGFWSLAANSMVSRRNLPGDKHYIIAKYTTERNIYRSPFNLMFMMLQEGFIQILPSKAAQKLIKQSQKNNKKKSSTA